MRRILLFTLGVMFVLLAAPATASSAPDFDTTQALARATHLAVAIGERAAGEPGEAAAASYIAETAGSYGYQVALQPVPFQRFTVPFTSTNVIAVKPGVPGYGTLYIGAHYDTVYRPLPDWPLGGPGANDNASGAAVMLEAARVLASVPLSPTIVFVAFGAEETGLVGSIYYVDHLPIADRVTADGMINLDCVGIGDLFGVYWRDPDHKAFADSLGVAADVAQPNTSAQSDHVSFAAAHIPAVFLNTNDSGDPECGPNYHLPTDTIDTLEPAALGRTGRAVVEAIQRVAANAQPRQARFVFLPVAFNRAAPTRAH